MTGIAELENWVLSLLGKHECVIVPKLGAFLIRHAPASANPFNGEIKPSGDTLFFNPSVQNDDGLLISEMKVELGCDYATAAATLQKLVDEIEQTAVSQRMCKMGQLGNFFVNAEGKLLFLPRPTLNLSRNTFGLPVIGILQGQTKAENGETRIIQKEKEAVTAEPDEVHEDALVVDISEHETGRKNRSYIWKAAAVISFFTMSVGGGFVLMNYLESSSENQLASSFPAVARPAKTEVVEKKQENSVYPGGAEGIKQQMLHLRNGKGYVFICGGSHLNKQMAELEMKRWMVLGVPAILCKREGSSLLKVMLGRFQTEQEASDFLAKMPGNSGYSAGLMSADLTPID